jgi:ABC-2 type transport system permease protein
MQADLADQQELQERLTRRREELMRQYGVTAMNLVPVGFQGISLQEGENHGNEVFDRHYGQVFDIYGAQNRVQQFAGVAAPMVPMRALSMALAGTDFAHHRDFVRAAEDYRRALQRILNDDIARNARPGVAYTAGPELWSKVPEFDYELPGIRRVISQNWISVILLLGWFAVSVVFVARVRLGQGAD